MTRSTIRFGGAALAAGFAVMLSLLPGTSVAQELSGKTVKLGAIVPSSGPFAEWGRTNTVTLKMLEEEVNEAGGVNGATLEIIIFDDSAQPAQAANALRKLGGDDEVLAVAGPLTSSAAEVTFPVANQIGVVATSQASSKPGVAANNRPWAFRNTVDEGILANTSVPYFKDNFGIEKVAIIYDAKDAVSTAIATRIMPAVMQENGIEVLNAANPLSFNTGDLDVSAQVTNLKSLDPDGVVIGADYSEAMTILREMKRQGLMKPVIGGTPLISSAILNAAPEIPLIAPATFYTGMEAERAQEFVDKLAPLLEAEAGLPDEIEPSMYDANIYEIMNMYIDAVENEGVTADPADLESDRVKIREHMEQLKDFQGLGGPISFNENGDAVKAFYIVQGENGSWETKVRGCSAEDESRC
jgi:branched-chain amino acid transport system substrate-binding protein